MGRVLYEKSRSCLVEGIRHLVTALGLPIMMWVMLEFVAGGRLSESEPLIYSVTMLVSVVLILVFAIPELRRKKEFRFVVSEEEVECLCPGEENYRVATADIEAITQHKSAAASTFYEEYIELKNGKKLKIPNRYGMSLTTAVKMIRQANPNIKRSVVTKY